MMESEYEAGRNQESIDELNAGFSPLSRGWNRRTEFLANTCKIIKSNEEY